MALKRHFLLAAVVWAFCGVMIALCVAFGVAFDRRYGAIETIAAIIPQATVLGVVLVAAFTRKSLRPPNYPRIEHLRIARKYRAGGSSAQMGISPLHLKG